MTKGRGDRLIENGQLLNLRVVWADIACCGAIWSRQMATLCCHSNVGHHHIATVRSSACWHSARRHIADTAAVTHPSLHLIAMMIYMCARWEGTIAYSRRNFDRETHEITDCVSGRESDGRF